MLFHQLLIVQTLFVISNVLDNQSIEMVYQLMDWKFKFIFVTFGSNDDTVAATVVVLALSSISSSLDNCSNL